MLHTKNDARSISVWLHGEHYSLVVLLAQPACFEQRHGRAAILAGDGSCPEVGDGGLAIYRWVEALEVCLRLLQHPPAPGAHVPCQVCLDRDHMGLYTRQLWLLCLFFL